MSESTLKLHLYESTRQLSFSGNVRPGQKLAERNPGESLKVSRTPIREVLGRLVRTGCLSLPLSDGDIDDFVAAFERSLVAVGALDRA